MPLFRCDEIANGEAAGFSVKGFARKYTRVFRLWGTELVDSPISLIDEAQELLLIPYLFSAYEGPDGSFDTGARLVEYNPRRGENPFWWIVSCEYSSQLDDLFRQNTPEMARDAAAGNNEQFQDPFAQPPSIEWDGVDWQRPLQKSLVIAQGQTMTVGGNPGDFGPTAIEILPDDNWTPTVSDIGLGLVDSKGTVSIIIGVIGNTSWVVSCPGNYVPPEGPWILGGDPCLNSAFCRFDPLPEVADSLPTLTITRNELSFDPSIAQTYANLVNSDPFYGANPGQAKMRRPRAASAYENGIFYYKVTYKIDFKPYAEIWMTPNGEVVVPGWRVCILDAGYQILNQASPPMPINWPTPNTSDSSAHPILLDGTGQKAGTALSRTGAVAGAERQPFYRQFAGYRTGPFAPLQLPFNIPQH